MSLSAFWFGDTRAGSYCQRTPHPEYLVAYEMQTFKFYRILLEFEPSVLWKNRPCSVIQIDHNKKDGDVDVDLKKSSLRI